MSERGERPWLWTTSLEEGARWSEASFELVEDACRDALAHGDLEPGESFWVGRAREFVGSDAAGAMLEFDAAAIDERLGDLGWFSEEPLVEAELNDAQRAVLKRSVGDWLDEWGVLASWFRVEDVRAFVVESSGDSWAFVEKVRPEP